MIFEIYWSDLNREAKKRLKAMYHENIELSPIAIVEIEDELEEQIFTEDQQDEMLYEEYKHKLMF